MKPYRYIRSKCTGVLLLCALVLAAGATSGAEQARRTQKAKPIQTTPVKPKRRPARMLLPEEKVARPNKEIDAYIRAEMRKNRLVGLGLGVVRNGNVSYLKGYGWQDREARIPVHSRKTMFRWASISKTITAIAAKKLELAGKLKLDNVVSIYYPDFHPPKSYLRKCSPGSKTNHKGKEISCEDGFFEIPLELQERYVTMRMLLGHLAGIMHYSNGKDSPVPPESVINDPAQNKGFAWALDYFINKPLVNKPRQKMSYTTFGFNLAGAVVEKAGGNSFHNQVVAAVAQPLGMTTLQPDYQWKSIPNRAVGYEKKADPEDGKPSATLASSDTVVRQGSSDVSWKLPGGGYISTVRDLARYCGGLMGEKIMRRKELEAMWVSQKTAGGSTTGVGLSFFLGGRDGHRNVTHSGSQQKAVTYLNLAPDDNLCVVVMSNSTYADVKKIAQDVEDIVREQTRKATLKN